MSKSSVDPPKSEDNMTPEERIKARQEREDEKQRQDNQKWQEARRKALEEEKRAKEPSAKAKKLCEFQSQFKTDISETLQQALQSESQINALINDEQFNGVGYRLNLLRNINHLKQNYDGDVEKFEKELNALYADAADRNLLGNTVPLDNIFDKIELLENQLYTEIFDIEIAGKNDIAIEDIVKKANETPVAKDNKKNTFTIPEEEWKSAKQFFKNNPKATKMERKKHDDITHSFIKVGDEIYALSHSKEKNAMAGEGTFALGEGAFSKVKVVQSESGENFALKVEGRGLRGKKNTELKIMKTIGFAKGEAVHKFSNQKFFKGKNVNEKLYTITRLSKGTELYKMLYTDEKEKGKERNKKRNPEQNHETKLLIALKACQAIQELHENRILHADIKPQNFMVKAEGTQVDVEVLDFGESKILGKKDNSVTDQPKGTQLYMAPEVLAALNVIRPNLVLMKNLPEDEDLGNNIYVEIKGDKLKYVMNSPTGEKVKGNLNIRSFGIDLPENMQTDDILKLNNLLEFKTKIMEEVIKKGHFDPGGRYSFASDVFALGIMLRDDLKLTEAPNSNLYSGMLKQDPKERAQLSSVIHLLISELEKIPNPDDNIKQTIKEAKERLEKNKKQKKRSRKSKFARLVKFINRVKIPEKKVVEEKQTQPQSVTQQIALPHSTSQQPVQLQSTTQQPISVPQRKPLPPVPTAKTPQGLPSVPTTAKPTQDPPPVPPKPKPKRSTASPQELLLDQNHAFTPSFQNHHVHQGKEKENEKPPAQLTTEETESTTLKTSTEHMHRK